MNNTNTEIAPSYANSSGRWWWLHETMDHLWPWTQQGWRHHMAIQGVGLVFAVAATFAWALAASGRLEAGAIIGWWLGWSAYETIIRLQCKPYIKVGPWWGRHYRRAGRMDMICYVMFKNLLIGAVFFIALRRLGLLHMVS